MTTPNRYLVPSVGTTPNNVGILSGNTVALIAGSVCNKTANSVLASVWANTGSIANTYYMNNVIVSPNSTVTIFGEPQKQFLLTGDALYVSCNVNGGFDFILSTAEGF